MQILPEGAKTDRQTDRGTYVTKVILATCEGAENNAFTHGKQYRYDFKTQQKKLKVFGSSTNNTEA